jgi:hypothetical protein
LAETFLPVLCVSACSQNFSATTKIITYNSIYVVLCFIAGEIVTFMVAVKVFMVLPFKKAFKINSDFVKTHKNSRQVIKSSNGDTRTLSVAQLDSAIKFVHKYDHQTWGKIYLILYFHSIPSVWDIPFSKISN